MRKSVVGRMLKDRKIHRQPRRSEAFYKRCRRDEIRSEGAKKCRKKMEEERSDEKQNSNCDALSRCIKN